MLHLASILPAFVIGTYMMVRRKGTPLHRRLGRIYMVLMLLTALVTLFMPAQVGPRWLDHFGFIHVFSLLVFYSVPRGWQAARRGNIRQHRGSMIGLYVGGLLIAGAFTFAPGRLLHDWVFGTHLHHPVSSAPAATVKASV
ncbi:MAG: DUF2306 domain-containing protein [Herminiimonas sp.]|nr:DUF2306 domain-containing protein [Herminiimonas sp.]